MHFFYRHFFSSFYFIFHFHFLNMNFHFWMVQLVIAFFLHFPTNHTGNIARSLYTIQCQYYDIFLLFFESDRFVDIYSIWLWKTSWFNLKMLAWKYLQLLGSVLFFSNCNNSYIHTEFSMWNRLNMKTFQLPRSFKCPQRRMCGSLWWQMSVYTYVIDKWFWIRCITILVEKRKKK